jgi:hypothetical protein
MSLADDFKTFCNNIQLNNRGDMEISAGEIAKKLNTHYYELDQDDCSHLYIVGSVGRNTAIKNSSDLDIIFDLPESVYKRFNDYDTNGQSALLQKVKIIIQERYPKTKIRGDGQVIVIEFTKYTLELVPAFLQTDNRFKFPDTHDGGSWKYTDPLKEQEECALCEERSKKNFYNFCHIMRSWKNTIGFEFGGLLIDTLVYNHFSENNDYADKGYSDYFTILQNLFNYLKNQDKNQSYWLAVGSNQQVSNSGNGAFINKAQKALNEIAKADDKNILLITLLGNEFPAIQKVTKNFFEGLNSSYRNTEQFIEKMFTVDIRYLLQLDCKVTQDGWRDFLLSTILRGHGILRHNKNLDFFINKTDCPWPYSIYWKVRNVGSVAEKNDCIRGQIIKTDSNHHKEHTDFQGAHYVECYLIKNNICVAKARIDVPIGNF